MIISTKQLLVDFKDQPIKEGTNDVSVGLLMSNILSGPTENPYKAYILAKKFAQDDEIELKAEDIVYLKKVLEKATHLPSMYAGQILEMFDK